MVCWHEKVNNIVVLKNHIVREKANLLPSILHVDNLRNNQVVDVDPTPKKKSASGYFFPVRLYLQVATLSDISDGNGQTVNKAIMAGK